jgi:putative transposase
LRIQCTRQRCQVEPIIRLIGAVLLEANDEWQLQHRYMQTEPVAELTPPTINAVPNRISTVAV